MFSGHGSFQNALVAATLLGCGGDDLTLPGDSGPARLEVIAGDDQSAPAGGWLGEPLTVVALDGAGRPVEGAAVRFTAEAEGAEIDPVLDQTDQRGWATAEVRLGPAPGPQEVEASVGEALQVRFQMTAIANDDGGGGAGGGGEDGDGGRGRGKGKGKGK